MKQFGQILQVNINFNILVFSSTVLLRLQHKVGTLILNYIGITDRQVCEELQATRSLSPVHFNTGSPQGRCFFNYNNLIFPPSWLQTVLPNVSSNFDMEKNFSQVITRTRIYLLLKCVWIFKVVLSVLYIKLKIKDAPFIKSLNY